MPCTPDTSCATIPTDQSYTATPNLQAPSPTIHYASMGWVGYIFLRSNKLGANNILRVTSANVNLKQEISRPDVLDGRIDKTVYQPGPKMVDGSISMPVVIDVQDPDSFNGCPNISDLTNNSVAGSVLNNLWCWTTARGNHGRQLYDDVNFDIRYANSTAYIFDNTICNTLALSVTQGDMVKLDLNVIGRGRQRPTDPTKEPIISDFLSPARVLTWNDVTVNGVQGCGSSNTDLFFSNSIRSWSLNINNNAERFFSLNGSLYPIDVVFGKREITGSMTLLGVQERLRKLADTNQDRFTEKNELRFSFHVGESTEVNTPNGIAFTSRDWKAGMAVPPGNPIFYRKLTAVVFQIESVELRNSVLESSVEYFGMANDQTNYEAISASSSCSFPSWS